MKKLLIILILFSLTGCGQQLGQEVRDVSIADKYDAATQIKAKYQLDEAQLIKREIKNAELDKYKSEPKDEITVTIGDKTDLLGGPAEFKPDIELKRWNEVSFKLKTDNLLKDVKSKELNFENDRIKFDTPAMSFEMYDTEDAYKYVWYLNEKPKTNKVEFQIESTGLDFFYQPGLTQEEKDAGMERPENVIGSYAVYHQTKGRMNDIDGKDYKVGKAFHIYRPHIIDANGTETWGILHIENGIYSVEIPQEFLDKAVYPIKSNDTFGYTTLGGTWDSTGANTFRGSTFASPGSGTVTSITHYFYNSAAGARDANFGFYNGEAGSIGTHVANGVSTSIAKGFSDWQTINVSGSVSAANYWLVAQAGAGVFWAKYDAGATNQGGISTAITYDTWSDSPSLTYSTRKYSIYATYTASAPATSIKPSIIYFE